MPVPRLQPLRPVVAPLSGPVRLTAAGSATPALVDRLDAPAPIRLDSSSADLVLFSRMRRGELSLIDGMARVARNGGWPIATPNGFIVASPADGRDQVRLAGSFNGWQPQAMNRNGDLFWSVIPRQQEPITYKLVDASGYRADPWARRYRYDDYGEISLTHSPGQHLERWLDVTDGVCQPRTVRVWVPREAPTHHLYAHDGQSLFGGGWHLEEHVGPHTLVIGIETEANRFEDLTPMVDVLDGEQRGGGGAKYADFVERTLRPQIERRYGRPEKVGVLGASLGGLMALYQALRFPDAYDFVASMSGTLGWGTLGTQGESLIDWYQRAAPGRATLYVDSGGNPGAGDNYDHNLRFVETLRQRGWVSDQGLYYWHEPGAPHHHSAWAARLHRPLSIFEGR